MSVGSFIFKKRKELGLSQEDLAEKLNVSRPTVSTWETGKNMPDISNIKMLAKLFNCTIDELINPTQPRREKTRAGETETI